jgi:hypothetical protein
MKGEAKTSDVANRGEITGIMIALADAVVWIRPKAIQRKGKKVLFHGTKRELCCVAVKSGSMRMAYGEFKGEREA